MTNESFEDRIHEIEGIIADLLPEFRERLHELVQETREKYDGIRESGQAARAALDDLRLCCKYLLFDAEASHRESRMGSDPRTDGSPA